MRKWVPLAQMEVADNKGATEDSYIEPVSQNTEGNRIAPLTSTLISWILLSPDQKNTTFTTFLYSLRPHMYIQRIEAFWIDSDTRQLPQ